MTIISISRAFCTKGQFIAEQVAQRLGYKCVSREILLEASDVFNVDEIKLAKAIHDGPSFFDRMTQGKEKYLAYLRAILLNHIKSSNVVYHGLAGHFYLQGIKHALKVRLITDFESRIQEEMIRENITRSLAKKRLIKDRADRIKWSRYVHGVDTTDPEFYDMILNLKQISIENCIDMICTTALSPSFQTTFESKRTLNNLVLEANVKALIIDKYCDAAVRADGGHLKIEFPKSISSKTSLFSDIERLLKPLAGIRKLEIIVEEEVTPGSLMYLARH